MARKLKAALANYQLQNKHQQQQDRKSQHASKLKIEQKAAQAARTRSQQRPSKDAWLPFAIALQDYTDKSLLLVGEGDFSFAVSVAEKFPNLPLVASSLDTREELEHKYPDSAPANLRLLDQLEVPILTGVDATKLALQRQKSAIFQSADIGMALFNFPHLGNSMADQDRNIRQHQQLLLKFFQQCAECDIPKVVVTLFEGEPYASWRPKQLARSAGYKLERSGQFPWEMFPNYSHQLTSKGGAHTSKKQSQRAARMHLWVRDNPIKKTGQGNNESKDTKDTKDNKGKKNQENKNDSDDDEP